MVKNAILPDSAKLDAELRDPTAFPAPSLLLLTRLEATKLVSTRSGSWLLVCIAVAVLAVMASVFAAPAGTRTSLTFLTVGSALASVLLPICAILSLTTEWSQRSVLTTFALVPQRHRILLAKTIALLVLALVAVVALCGAAAAMNALAAGAFGAPDGVWDVKWSHVGGVYLGITLSMLIGVAFGALFMNPALSIVVYLVLPLMWSLVSQLVEQLKEASLWLDTSLTFRPLLDGSIDGQQEWSRVAVSAAVWVLVPLALGMVRIFRREIK